MWPRWGTESRKRMKRSSNVRCNLRWAKTIWKGISPMGFVMLTELLEKYQFSIPMGDILFLDGRWYVTHVGLIRLAQRNACAGIRVELVRELSDAALRRWTFKARVYTSRSCKGFVGYGDADPSNVSPLFHGSELRIGETRAVNRALRKAYGIGICSVEELACSTRSTGPARESKKLPPQPANGNYGAPKVRD